MHFFPGEATVVANDNFSKIKPATLRTLKETNLLFLHAQALAFDLTFVVMAQLHKVEENKDVIHHFIQELIQYRQDVCFVPTHLDSGPYLLSIMGSFGKVDNIDLVDQLFETLRHRAQELPYTAKEMENFHFQNMNLLKNTSEGIKRFIDWQETLESRRLFGELNLDDVSKSVLNLVHTYVTKHAKLSKRQMKNDFVIAYQKAEDRAQQENLEVRKGRVDSTFLNRLNKAF